MNEKRSHYNSNNNNNHHCRRWLLCVTEEDALTGFATLENEKISSTVPKNGREESFVLNPSYRDERREKVNVNFF